MNLRIMYCILTAAVCLFFFHLWKEPIWLGIVIFALFGAVIIQLAEILEELAEILEELRRKK